MRRSSHALELFRILRLVGLVGLSGIGGAPACAKAVDGDLEELGPPEVSAEAGVDASPGVRAADASPPQVTDARASVDARADAAIDAVDGATTGVVDSAPPEIDAAPTTLDCPATSGLYTAKYLLLLSSDAAAPGPCPCATGECCYKPGGAAPLGVCLAI